MCRHVQIRILGIIYESTQILTRITSEFKYSYFSYLYEKIDLLKSINLSFWLQRSIFGFKFSILHIVSRIQVPMPLYAQTQ